jgi:hypothetical protein
MDSGYRSFDRIATTALGTLAVLRYRFAEPHARDQQLQNFLASDSLPYVGRVAKGLRISTRNADAGLSLERILVHRAGIIDAPLPWTAEGLAAAAEAVGLRYGQGTPFDLTAGEQLEAAGHARVVFALLPSMPSYAISWKGRRQPSSYGDINAPRGLEEVTERVEELERVLWAVAVGPVGADAYVRRTYAFFEAAALLATGGFGAFEV